MSLTLAGCEFGFEPQITPLVIPTLPPPAIFTTPVSPRQPPVLVTEPAEGLPIGPVESTPQVELLCTTDYLRLRDQPSTNGAEVMMMPPGAQVSWTGQQANADGYTWYEVSMMDTIQGWAAADWLEAGECAAPAGGTGAFGLIESGWISGYEWLDPDSDLEHFGVDLQSLTGNHEISSPYSDEVVVSDACSACTEADSVEGNTLGDTKLGYNFGYGAMIVVEYTYGDLTEADRTQLSDSGIELAAGQSLYVMVAHLDPSQTLAAGGSVLAEGTSMANIGNSGNSDGAHAHVEMAINESGLAPTEDQATAQFWLDTVAEQAFRSTVQSERQGNRFDPTPLFE